MRILHLADAHLRDKDIDEAEECLNFVVATAQLERPDLVVIAGDLFDSQDIKLDSKSAKLAGIFLQQLADLAPVLVAIGTPSHEGTAPEIYELIDGVYVSVKPEQVFLQDGRIVDVETVAEYGGAEAVLSVIPTPTKQFFQGSNEEISAALNGIFSGFGAQAFSYKLPHILVYHGSVSGATLSNHQIMTGRDIEISRDQFALAGADLVLCGHIHLPQKIGDNIFYSGSLFPTTWGEDHEHGFYIHELLYPIESPDHLRCESRFFETPCRRLLRIKDDLTTGNFLTDLCKVENVGGAYVRYDITCWQDEAEGVKKDAIERVLREAGALDVDIRINRIPRENIRAEAVLKAETLRDKLTQQAGLRGETVDESILVKADMLEDNQADEVLQGITGGQNETAKIAA